MFGELKKCLEKKMKKLVRVIIKKSPTYHIQNIVPKSSNSGVTITPQAL